jgi:hypothetical protein
MGITSLPGEFSLTSPGTRILSLAKMTKDLPALQKAASDAKAAQQAVETNLAIQQERAANAERELLELQRKLADRTLSNEQVEAIARSLKPFSGQEYDVTAYWDSRESVGIANRISESLQKAGWAFLSMAQWRAMLGGVVGVLVWSHPEADQRTKEAAQSLVAELTREGIQVESRTQNPTNNPKHNRISISVGSNR